MFPEHRGPNRTDPSAAPEACDDLMVLVPVGHMDDAVDQNWDALRVRARQAGLDRLRRIGVDEVDEHLKFEVHYGPRDWQRLFNLTHGVAFGRGKLAARNNQIPTLLEPL